ncbi:MAG: B12-binding domain-containing radical SAM protein [Pseudodesulfovibrio sp.]|uniref:Radical SAM domain protein n=1 Tax=Pseudodesulfovibrio aespoeensis (strain ATCC 700646 / DSM 10631 / Aspo-2) TaxID=643562 RepID=E6VUG4_PSEA9|nr:MULTISPECIES: B12-binding domain-containing radical SAM protein [Pseudodesulfovibrio]MBU4191829.1 B12-binding domain-containing radical SAM protein [Pseudomonadota bacterium]ADU61109.1 Radical SAM domain protein [Pseudodesulfovibrio aespoeensis Aspo-2]MBU4244127.1 B12-binding domain-containing radical SAM protein [Pseudomonadota bacterium]MBU4378731.1 B12-binding domain-containing radical SAM protein [Pseudomonadota bacterium]MBU4476488.1 B12-binding domain-containing radical SAM protein [P
MTRHDIVFLKPGSQKALYGELSDFKLTGLEPPLWGAILAGFMRAKGYATALFDAEIEGWSWQEAAARVVEAGPTLAVISVSGSNPSASTMNMVGASAIARHIKEIAPTMPVAICGLHPSALPGRTCEEEHVDFVVRGEGFETLPQLVEALKAGADLAAIAGIQGLAFRDGDRTVETAMPALLDDLDTLPRPAWDLLPMERYRAHNWHCFDDITRRQPYAVLYTSLGCPFKCSFCCINALFGRNTIRYRGVDSVIDEIDYLVNTYGIRNIKIMDEMFAMNEKRVAALCDRIIERGYDLNFWAYARVNTVSPGMLAKMKRAGINWVSYGFESGSKRVINDVTKGYDTSKVMEVVRQTYDEGLHICANYIFGLPEDDFESMNETLQMMFEINAEWANIYAAMALPGSQLYTLALENRWPLPESWQAYSQYAPNSLPLPTKYLSGGQVLAFRDYAFDAYYKNPGYLNMVREKFGTQTMEYVIAMSHKKLERQHAVI